MNKEEEIDDSGEVYFESWNMSEDELYDASNSFDTTVEDIKLELRDLVYLWLGHSNFLWATLTPLNLFELNKRCSYIRKTVQLFFEDVYRVLGPVKSDSYGRMMADYEDLIYQFEFEWELMQVIQKSYEFSSGKSQGMNGIIDLDLYDKKYTGWQRKILTPITVAPWKIPPPPRLVAPERPRVILKVLSVEDGAPRVSVGFDDVFCSDPIGVGILVDEDVKVGDCVIVKTSGWQGIGHEMVKPEYDGLAEPDCPCSEIDEVMEARYDFDLEVEQAMLETKWNDSWLNKHFKIESETAIRQSGRISFNYFECGDDECEPEYEDYGYEWDECDTVEYDKVPQE